MRLAERLALVATALVLVVVLVVGLTVDGLRWRELVRPGLLSLLVAGAGAFLVARSLGKPVRQLNDITRALAEGDTRTRPPLAAPGDLGDLATAINRLADQLGARITALQGSEALLAGLLDSLSEGVIAIDEAHRVVRTNEAARNLLKIRDDPPFPIDRLPRDRRIYEAIRDALQGASRGPEEHSVGGRTLSITARPLSGGGAVLCAIDLTASKRMETTRRDFVANVSHELRTPLSIVGGFAETLADPAVPEEQRAVFAASILGNTRRMQRVVSDLLDLSRIESGTWVPSRVSIDLADAARDAMESLGQNGRSAAVTLIVDSSPNRLHADPTALRQVLQNLVENALRHTASGTVRISAAPVEGGVLLSVTDTGEGIAPEHLPRVFERFYRVDGDRARSGGGTGLGLAIVKHLVEAHGGQVGVESRPGHGSTFTAFFPAPSA